MKSKIIIIHKSILLFVFIVSVLASCSKDDCRTCTGTVTTSGDAADWTVCAEDDGLVQTNNLTGTAEETNNTLAQSVAFFESIGLTCTK